MRRFDRAGRQGTWVRRYPHAAVPGRMAQPFWGAACDVGPEPKTGFRSGGSAHSNDRTMTLSSVEDGNLTDPRRRRWNVAAGADRPMAHPKESSVSIGPRRRTIEERKPNIRRFVDAKGRPLA